MYIGYAIVTFFLALFLSNKTDRKLFSFVLIYWLLSQPVLGYLLNIDLPGLPDLQPNRLLLLALLIFLFFVSYKEKEEKSNASSAYTAPIFEKFLFVYPAIVFISLVVNYGSIRTQDIVIEPLYIITFIVLYLSAKKFITRKVFESLISAIIILSVIGVAISYVQYAIDGTFFRTGGVRAAFGEITRASGIFKEEFDFGVFQILGVMAVMIRYKGSLLRYLLAPPIAISVILTFHRLDIIILFTCILVYFILFTDLKGKAFTTIIASFVLIVSVVAYPLISSVISKSTVATTLEGRISQNTVTGRIAQYGVVAEYVFTDYTLLGMGAYENPDYDKLMKKHGMVNYDVNGRLIGFRVHNGYLEVGILRGVVAMFLFIAIIVAMLIYLKGKSRSDYYISAIPFFAVLIWALSNASNGLSSFNFYYAMLCAMLAGSFVALNKKGLLS